MKKIITATLSILSISLSLNAQAPQEKTLLWEVTGKGIKQPSYLYGTIHLMCPQDLKMPAVVKEKFNTVKQLYLELDMDDPNLMKEMMQGMQMKDTNTIQGLLGEARFDSTNKVFKSTTGIDLKMMNKAKPMLLMSLVYPSMLGCMPESWEKAFQDMAAQRKIELKGLENLSDQVAVFEKIPYKVQADMLARMMQDLDSTKNTFTKMLKIYHSKDINAMVALTTANEDFGEYEGVLLNDRNRNWIPVIGEEAKKNPTFFAVGAGHLGGVNGVISLLRKAGFIVKPVMYK